MCHDAAAAASTARVEGTVVGGEGAETVGEEIGLGVFEAVRFGGLAGRV